MHILKARNEVIISPDNIIKAGVEYLVEDTNGAQLMTHANGGTMTPLVEQRKPLFSAPGNELLASRHSGSEQGGITPISRLLFVRVGGLGDLTLLTPILREINRRWPTVKIDVACHKEFSQAIENLPYCTPVQFPMTLETAQTYDAWCFLENAIEGNEDAKTLHSVDVVAKMIGLDMTDANKVQDYVITEREKIWQEVAFPRVPDVRRIAIQFAASARCRTYPQAHTQRIVQHFIQKGWEVFMMGHEGSIKEVENEPKNFIRMTDGYTFRQRCAVLGTCDIVLAPDSSLAHIAGALNVPCVGLYGPFPWQVRTKYNPLTKGVNGVGKCAPCFHHQHMSKFFPKNCPSAGRNVCAVMESIKPERVIALLTKHARNASEIEAATEVPDEVVAQPVAEVVPMP